MVRSRHRNQLPAPASYPGVTGREQAMVLIGLIIIAVVLMALRMPGVPGSLRFAFLLITRMTSWLRLSRREEAWQTAEIVILRYQLAVLQGRQPGRQVDPRQGRPAGDPPDHQDPGPVAGPREPRMGISQDPRRAGRPGSEGSGVDGVGDPEECRDRPRAAAILSCLVAVPALPGRGDLGV